MDADANGATSLDECFTCPLNWDEWLAENTAQEIPDLFDGAAFDNNPCHDVNNSSIDETGHSALPHDANSPARLSSLPVRLDLSIQPRHTNSDYVVDEAMPYAEDSLGFFSTGLENMTDVELLDNGNQLLAADHSNLTYAYEGFLSENPTTLEVAGRGVFQHVEFDFDNTQALSSAATNPRLTPADLTWLCDLETSGCSNQFEATLGNASLLMTDPTSTSTALIALPLRNDSQMDNSLDWTTATAAHESSITTDQTMISGNSTTATHSHGVPPTTEQTMIPENSASGKAGADQPGLEWIAYNQESFADDSHAPRPAQIFNLQGKSLKRGRREPLTDSKRKKVAEMRKLKACLLCKMQKKPVRQFHSIVLGEFIC